MTPDTTPDRIAFAGWTFAQSADGSLLPETSPDLAFRLDSARAQGTVYSLYQGAVEIPPDGRWTLAQLCAALSPYFALPPDWLDAVAPPDEIGLDPLY